MSVLESLLEDYSVDFIIDGQNSSGDYVNINCVTGDCVGDEKHKLGIHKSMGWAVCWACGRRNIYDVVRELGIPWKEFKILQEEEMDEWGLEQNSNKVITELPPETKGINIPGEEIQQVHRDYLESRGYDVDWLIKEYKIKGTIWHEREVRKTINGEQVKRKDYSLSHRVIFPVMHKGVPISYIARSYDPKETTRRYRCCDPCDELMFHKSLLFNADRATGDRVIVNEGMLDTLKLVQGSGRFDIVSTYGTAYTNEQLVYLRTHYKEVIVMYDNEPLAQQHAKEIVSYLQSYGVKAKSLNLKTVEDPGALDLETAKKLVNYLLDMEWRD